MLADVDGMSVDIELSESEVPVIGQGPKMDMSVIFRMNLINMQPF